MAFVDDGIFVTKAGDVGVVYRVQGQDYEASTTHNGATSCVVSKPRCGCSVSAAGCTRYFFKRQAPPITADRARRQSSIRP